MNKTSVENKRVITKCIIWGVLFVSFYVFFYKNLLDKLTYIWNFGEVYRDYSLIEPLYIWNPEGLGRINIMNPYLGLLLKILDTVTVNGHIILYLTLPLISYISFYISSRQLLDATEIESLVGGILYLLNPVLVSLFIMGEYGPLLAYSLQPLIFLGVYRILINRDKKWILLFQLIIPFAFANLYHAFWFILFTFIFIFIYHLLLKSKSDHIFRGLMMSLITILLINLIFLPVIIQYLVFINLPKTQTNYPTITITGYSYQDVSIENVFRLSGNKGSAQAEKYLNYNSLNLLTIFGHLIVALSVAPLISKKFFGRNKKTDAQIYLSSLLVYILVSSTILYISFNKDILSLHPLLFTLRNPIKLQTVQTLFFSYAFIFSLRIFRFTERNKGKGKKIFRNILVVIVVLSIFVYNSSSLDGTYGLERVRKSFYVNSDVLNSLNALNEKIDGKRGIIIPWTLEVQKMYPIKNIANPLTGSITTTGSNFSLINFLYEIIVFGDDAEIIKFLKLLDIKYIILVKEPVYDNIRIYKSFDTIMVEANINNILRKIYNTSLYTKIAENELLDIFEIRENVSRFSILYDYDDNETIMRYIKSKNLVINPSFDDRLINWRGYNNRSILIDQVTGNIMASIISDGTGFSSITQAIKNISDFRLYEFSFDYMLKSDVEGLHAKILWFNQTNNFDEKLSIRKDFFILNNEEKDVLLKFRAKITAPSGAKAARIVFLVKKGFVLIDNVEFVSLNPQFILKNFQLVKDYWYENPTLWKITVSNISKPFVLLFAETYNPNWYAYIYKGNISIKYTKSFPVFNSLNGFWIDETGDLTIVIRYVPQNWFESGLKISFITYVSSIAYLVWDAWKEKIRGIRHRKYS